MKTLMKYLKIYQIQIKNNFVRETVYRANFLTVALVDIIWIAIEFSFFSVIYSHVNTIAGWNEKQVFFFLGVYFTSDAIFTVLFQKNFWTFSDLVNKGVLDTILLKPIHPVFYILTQSINITSCLNIVLGLAVIIYYAQPAGFEGGWAWLHLLFWIVVGIYATLQIRFLFSVIVFWTDRNWAMVRLYYQLVAFASKPDQLYPQTIKLIMRTILPFAFIGSIPTQAVLHGLSQQEWCQVIIVLTIFTLLNKYLWNKGLDRYQSASS